MGRSRILTKITNFWFSLERNDKLIVLILVLSFIIRILFILYSPLRGWDESVYLNLGEDLSKNPLLYSLKNSGWRDFIPSSNVVYGWPNIGFRAPLLPYLFSIFYLINLSFLVDFIVPLFSTLSILLVYILGKRLLSSSTALYSAVLFSLLPIHIIYSSKTLTDAFVIFFVILTFISFWQGYEKDNKRHKILFGFFLALSLLARYTTLWLIPVFLFYFIIKDKSLKIFKDRYLWYAVAIFFLTLVPWFIYGIKYYANPFGSFIHGFNASSYWGGVQSWSFFITNSWQIFSIVGILFSFSILYILFKRDFLKKEIYLLLLWIFIFFFIVVLMPHKEDRFILPIVPAICLISGYFINTLGKYRNLVLGLICLVLIFSLFNFFKNDYSIEKAGVTTCFREGNIFLANKSIEKDSLIITNQSPIVYHYTKKRNFLYPEPFDLKTLKNGLDSDYADNKVYFLFSNYDMQIDGEIRKELDINFKKVFECKKGWGYSAVYKYK